MVGILIFQKKFAKSIEIQGRIFMVDFKSSIDLESRIEKGQARKILAELFNHRPNFVSFTKHALEKMRERNLKSGDILNVLRAGNILKNPEFENGSWRYSVETAKITVVFAFRTPNQIIVVTSWRN